MSEQLQAMVTAAREDERAAVFEKMQESLAQMRAEMEDAKEAAIIAVLKEELEARLEAVAHARLEERAARESAIAELKMEFEKKRGRNLVEEPKLETRPLNDPPASSSDDEMEDDKTLLHNRCLD